MKWVEIAAYPANRRFEFLSKTLAEAGVENSLEFIDTTPAGFEDELMAAMEKFDTIRIGRGLGNVVLQYFKQHTSEVRMLGAADSIIKKDGVWWLANMTYPSLQRVLSDVGSKLNITSEALIVGAGATARSACAAIVKMGFKIINITNEFDEQAADLINELRRTFFDVTFNFVPKDQLILLPGTNGILINTTPFTSQNDVLNELYYFNFLQRPGVAIDLVLSPPETLLIKEAKDISATTISGYEIASWADVMWSEAVAGVELDHKIYREGLRKALL